MLSREGVDERAADRACGSEHCDAHRGGKAYERVCTACDAFVVEPETPSPRDVERIVAIESPVVRNLEITYCYSRLAAACAARTGTGANWCTYATWASRQAGPTIRGEDLLAHLERRLGESRWLLHPIATLWRKLLRRGLFQRTTRLGRLTHALHTPFDAFERASDAVARGNLKVFEEIGLEFARYLHERGFSRAGDAPDDHSAAPGVHALRAPAVGTRSEETCRGRAAREPGDRPPRADAPAAGDPRGARRRLGNGAGSRAAGARGALPFRDALVAGRETPGRRDVGVVARAIQRASSKLAREVITDSFMTLALPGRVLALGTHLADAYPDVLQSPRTRS